jgi:hypothetical protein
MKRLVQVSVLRATDFDGTAEVVARKKIAVELCPGNVEQQQLQLSVGVEAADQEKQAAPE